MRLAPTRLVPFSYFWTCWNVRPKASPSFSWLMPSMMRRMRTRLPTYLSTGLGALVDISNTPWDYACGRGKTKAEYASGANTVKSCSEASVRNADNLSNELTGSTLGYRNRMRIAVSVCQLWISACRNFRRLPKKAMNMLGSGSLLRNTSPDHENQGSGHDDCGGNVAMARVNG